MSEFYSIIQIYSVLKSLALLRSTLFLSVPNRGHFWDKRQVEHALNENTVAKNPLALCDETWMPWRQVNCAATSPHCSHCFPLIAFMFLKCASPSKFPASQSSLHQCHFLCLYKRTSYLDYRTMEIAYDIVPNYHVTVKPKLIQSQSNFQALNLLLFPISQAKIHKYLRALQETDISRFET